MGESIVILRTLIKSEQIESIIGLFLMKQYIEFHSIIESFVMGELGGLSEIESVGKDYSSARDVKVREAFIRVLNEEVMYLQDKS